MYITQSKFALVSVWAVWTPPHNSLRVIIISLCLGVWQYEHTVNQQLIIIYIINLNKSKNVKIMSE